jgi:hypothetical protein
MYLQMDPSQSIQDGKTLHPYDRASEKLFSVSMVSLGFEFFLVLYSDRMSIVYAMLWIKFRAKLGVKMEQLCLFSFT